MGALRAPFVINTRFAADEAAERRCSTDDRRRRRKHQWHTEEERVNTVGRCMLAIVAIAAGGCNPTAPHEPTYATETLRGGVGPLSGVCAGVFAQVRPHLVNASVAPSSLDIELRAGPCAAGAPAIGASTSGSITLMLGKGTHHVWIINRHDDPVAYSVSVQYLAPGA